MWIFLFEGVASTLAVTCSKDNIKLGLSWVQGFKKRINNDAMWSKVGQWCVWVLTCLRVFLAGLSVNSQATLVGDTAPHSEDPQLLISQLAREDIHHTHLHLHLPKQQPWGWGCLIILRLNSDEITSVKDEATNNLCVCVIYFII